ncbi:MAG TPA: class I SAM-dependent RNA methyltransferase [Acidobacteriota bacterium]|nr:class I SAM-dependent RNA methyltransferase [Acidobacteriota bacterium]
MTNLAGSRKAFEVTIEKLVYGGMGLGRHAGKVVFVPFSVPGDRLRVRAIEEKKTFIRAGITQIVKSGKGRVAPVCPYFEKCGGCHLQQLDYLHQVDAKRQILEESLHHRFPETHELPVTMRACPQPMGYRSRARVQLRGAGEKATVGFYRYRSHAVEDIENCPLFRPSLNEALSSLRQFKLKVDLDISPQEMDLACSQEEDTWATARIGVQSGEGVTPLFGKRKTEDVILKRKVGSYIYSVTASVFFQANDFLISELAALVRELSANQGQDAALDLFSGVGLFSLPLARQFTKVIAVENSAAASRLCAANASAAGFRNIESVCADAASWMKSGEADSNRFDLIVLDPPRSGASADVMEQIRKQAPPVILYISCDPQTLVRDLACIAPRDYRIDFVQGLDMFPQTYHFETVIRLVRN